MLSVAIKNLGTVDMSSLRKILRIPRHGQCQQLDDQREKNDNTSLYHSPEMQTEAVVGNLVLDPEEREPLEIPVDQDGTACRTPQLLIY